MASTIDVEDDFVMLECSGSIGPESAGVGEISISTADISDWESPAILAHPIVRVKANRKRLVQESSYFSALLGGSFSESGMRSIPVHWNLGTFLDVIKCIHGCVLEVSSSNFLSLFQAALYFGVEILLLECGSWLSDDSNEIELDDLVHIHSFAFDHGVDSIRERCVSYMARNFMSVVACGNFVDAPWFLLVSCIEHPHLTVDSERHLSEALLAWVSANAQRPKPTNQNEYDSTSVLKQIRASLLPLWFAMAKQKCDYFAGLAEESIVNIFNLLRNPMTGFTTIAGNGDLNHLRIRLTEYTKKLDLSSCPQINSAILLLSLLPSSYSLDPVLEEYIRQAFMDRQYLSSGFWKSPQFKMLTVSFESVLEVDISKCPSIHLGAAIECFKESFPVLRTLKAAYLLDFDAINILQILGTCSFLHELDLSVDSSPVIPSQASIIGFPTARYIRQEPRVVLDPTSGCQSHVTKLILEGRTDISDSDLHVISGLCLSLSYLNIKGCYGVTDEGISYIIQKSVKLHSLVASDTKFGRCSILSLCSRISNMRKIQATPLENTEESFGVDLRMLHIDGCNGVDETSLLEFLSLSLALKSLCLRQTSLNDRALNSFSGSSLEFLDVSSTMVTGVALSYIVQKNPGLKSLKARGCKNLYQEVISTNKNSVSPLSYQCKELYNELGKSCKLEELTVGWGFSYFSVNVLRPAIMSLKAITIGLGGSVGPDGLMLLATVCPLLESVSLQFQIVSDDTLVKLIETLRNLRELEICNCIGDISLLSFSSNMPFLRRLKLERATPWMTNDDLALLTRNCANLVEVSLIGCMQLDADAQKIISHGWPGLISLHLEECGAITCGVGSLFDCKALEDLLLRHTPSPKISNHANPPKHELCRLRYHNAISLCAEGRPSCGQFN
ncbi:hypothetical protein Dimus_034733 [Dionaea muscipula]